MKPIYFLPAIAWFLLTVLLLCLPGSALPKQWFFSSIPQFDKLVHIVLFGTLCLFFSFPLKASQLNSNSRKQWFIAIAIIGIVYGTGMEFVQKNWIPNRSFELYDILADGIGCLLALGWSFWKFLPGRA